MLTFEWDPGKNKTNQRKHRVSFEEAQTAFYDEAAKYIEDPEHSNDEERFIPLGLSMQLRLLTVCYCCRKDNEVIQIISARKATQNETRHYKDRRS